MYRRAYNFVIGIAHATDEQASKRLSHTLANDSSSKVVLRVVRSKPAATVGLETPLTLCHQPKC